jgi:hypothetical protein
MWWSMITTMYALLAGFGSTLLLMCLLVYFKVKIVGLDPAIITMHSLVIIIHKPRYLLLAFTVSSTMVIAQTYYLLLFIVGIIAAAYTTHIALLILFGRFSTQPLLAYVCILITWCMFGLTIVSPYFAIVSAATFILAVFAQKHWDLHKAKIYHLWVYRRAYALDIKFNKILSTLPPRQRFCTLLVMTTEDIARPPASRFAERLYFYIKKPKRISSGIMQVMHTQLLSDEQSVARGSTLIAGILKTLPRKITESELKFFLAKGYNGSGSYSHLLNSIYPSVKKLAKEQGFYDKAIL